MTRRVRAILRWRWLVGPVLAGLLGLVTACSSLGLQHVTLGRSASGPSYNLDLIFTDASGLLPGATVRVRDVEVGRVSRIDAVGYRAHVHVSVRQSVNLPRGTTASLQYTTPLGDSFVELTPPPGPATVLLHDGDSIDTTDTSRQPDVEDFLAALSALLNGGGLDQIHTIVVELETALQGREPQVRDLINRLGDITGTLNNNVATIDRLMTSVDALAATLNDNQATVHATLTQISPALNVLAGQTGQFTQLLQHLSSLGETVQRVLSQAEAPLVSDLQALSPVLGTLLSVGDRLAPTLKLLLQLERQVPQAFVGDYLHLQIQLVAPVPLPTLPGSGGGR